MLRKVAIEEHFDHAAVKLPSDSHSADIEEQARVLGLELDWFKLVRERLYEFEERRLAAMDESGVDMAILSLTSPGVQGIADRAHAIRAAREINNFLAEVITRNPRRFAGFATLPLQDPKEAVRELERCVRDLGFKGALINGYTSTTESSRGQYLDEPVFLPFWEAASALSVPVYLHPRTGLDRRVYEGHDELAGATWGFGSETAMHALRLVFSGLFDRFPNLTLILGHLGEMLPYCAWRIQHCFEYNPFGKRLHKRLQDYLCENFYITTSGSLSDQALICALLTVGADRLLFAADYPYERMDEAARWIEAAPISENDRRKIAAGNARNLFRLE